MSHKSHAPKYVQLCTEGIILKFLCSLITKEVIKLIFWLSAGVKLGFRRWVSVMFFLDVLPDALHQVAGVWALAGNQTWAFRTTKTRDPLLSHQCPFFIKLAKIYKILSTNSKSNEFQQIIMANGSQKRFPPAFRPVISQRLYFLSFF